ncbi:P-loop NTPase family protein [Allopontixanthobacter confluentis]|uniref:capsular biosynthesis protein n=1 Tax=Allopontixanthobacter confluentis TaxID=1849021 RepID=UPI0019252466|nr:capsular biosynthesis protein [Allopontixanthobacter confluentis]
MTEHRKIPAPDAETGKGSASLFERAGGSYGLDQFRAPAVPAALPDAPRSQLRRPAQNDAAMRAAAMPQGAHGKPRDAAPLADGHMLPPARPAPRVPAAPAAPAAPLGAGKSAAPRVTFTGERFPIDRNHLRDQGMIVPEGPVTALIEEFRIVKRQILSSAMERETARSRRVLICSPHPGEGKTFCATNLAIAMAAERDREVLLVDADFAKPSILSTLGLPKGPGFMDCLADPSILPEDLVMGTDIPGLWVLPAGNQTAFDSEYLSAGRTAEVVDRLTVGAPDRIVIFDSPPALSASPAAELANHVGQAILVARADRTGQSALEDAVHLLSACPDIKLLLNATDYSPSGRNFGSYYGYGA